VDQEIKRLDDVFNNYSDYLFKRGCENLGKIKGKYSFGNYYGFGNASAIMEQGIADLHGWGINGEVCK